MSKLEKATEWLDAFNEQHPTLVMSIHVLALVMSIIALGLAL